ncbi:hypothetical protein PhaeoP66_03228 [Phaeobacter inhibens]|uniref:Uncharacterized protein n=2 Tax=Phaeobacter inhibens TaxID=221822 RepID=A0ABN5GRF3_9RHOB|nr:hypothetical protein PhaeoP66_03228 [Phaeobacter inhibens]
METPFSDKLDEQQKKCEPHFFIPFFGGNDKCDNCHVDIEDWRGYEAELAEIARDPARDAAYRKRLEPIAAAALQELLSGNAFSSASATVFGAGSEMYEAAAGEAVSYARALIAKIDAQEAPR